MLVENSRFGLALLAIRQNELAAEAAGINARRWKMRALVVSGMIAAAAGGLYACVLLVVTPDSVFGMLVSAQAVVVTLFGGVAAVWGPVIGAAILVPLAESLNAELGNILPGIQGVVYGAAIIVIMLAAPEGLFWTIRDRLFRRALPPPAPLAAATPVPRVTSAAQSPAPLLEVTGLSRSFGGLRAVSEVSFRGRRGRDPRHHRPQRRRQDHAVQRAERRADGRCGQRDARRAIDAGPQGAPGLPHGRRPHLPGGAQLSAPAAAGQRDRRRLRRRTAGRSGGGRGRRRAGIASGCIARPARRPGNSPTSSCG